MAGTSTEPRAAALEVGGGKGPTRAVVALRRALADERLSTALVYAISLLVVFALWEWSAQAFGLLALFPPPTVTVKRFAELVLDGTLEAAAVVSLLRILAGFLVGSLAGTALGLLMGSSPVVRALAEPYVHFLRFVPPLAWFAPVLLWFGTGESTRVLLIFYTTVFVVALNAMAGVAAVARNKVRMARAFGANRRQVFFLITLPASLPFIFTGMRMAMGNSFMTVVAAEMLGATEGLGYFVLSSQFWLDIAAIFSGVIALGVLGFAADHLFQWLIRRYGAKYGVQQSAFQ